MTPTPTTTPTLEPCPTCAFSSEPKLLGLVCESNETAHLYCKYCGDTTAMLSTQLHRVPKSMAIIARLDAPAVNVEATLEAIQSAATDSVAVDLTMPRKRGRPKKIWDNESDPARGRKKRKPRQG